MSHLESDCPVWWLIAFFDKKRLVRHKKAATMSSSVTAPLPSYYLHNMHWCGACHVVEQIAQPIDCKKNHSRFSTFFGGQKLSYLWCVMIVVCKMGNQLQSCVPSWRADNPILVDVYIRGRPLAMNMTISLGIERVKFDLNKAGELLTCYL